MAREGTTPGRGWGLRETRASFENLDSSLSSYTQANPRPGSQVSTDARAKLTPSISGDQQQDETIYVVKAGLPGIDPDDHVGIAYKKESEASTEWRGWSRPNFLSGWAALEWSDTYRNDYFDCVTIPSSQKVVAVYTISDGAGARTVSRTLNPSTWTWSSAAVIRANSASTNYDCAVCVLPDERLLAISNRPVNPTATKAYYSDDAGATWSEYSDAPIAYTYASEVTSGARATMVCEPISGQIAYLRTVNDGVSQDAYQLASNDLGANFTLVNAAWTVNAPYKPTLLALKSGRIALVHEANGGANNGLPVVRVVGSAYESLEDASEVQVDSSASVLGLGAWVDADGVVYVYIARALGSEIRVSYDECATWEATGVGTGDGGRFSTGADYPIGVKCAPTMGRAVVLHQWVADTGNEDGSLGAMLLGGWSNVECGEWSDGLLGATWIPIERPGDTGIWTAAGAGTDSLDSPGEMSITTAANGRSYNVAVSAGYRDLLALAEFRVDSGGSLTVAQCGFTLDVGNGATRYRLRVNANTTDFRVNDNTTAIGTVTIDMTQDIQILAYVNGSTFEAKTWYRRPSSDQWITGPAGTLTGAGSATTTNVDWGHNANGTVTSHWTQFHYIDSTAGAGTPASALANLEGKPLSVRPYPAPDIGTDGTTAGFLACAGGPGRLGETYDIPAAYDYGVERMFPEISPSPAERWRSTGTASDCIFAWDLDMDTSLGNGSVFLYLDGINFRQALLEGWNGAAWVTIGTFDARADFTGIDFSRTGDMVVPTSTTAQGSRYLWFGEAVGGTFDLGGGTLRRIRRQTEGSWYPSATQTVRVPRIWLNDVNDGADPTSATGHLLLPRGVLVVHNVGSYDRYRVQIPAQSTADGYFECGVMMIGGVHPAGKQWSRGWSVERSPNAETTRDRFGTSRTRENGPPLRRLSFACPDGVMLQIPRSRTANYISADTGNPLATKDDIPHWLEGILADVKSGEVPMLLLQAIPDTSDTTLTDWTQFVYGRVVSSVAVENVTGTEGSNEYHRVNQIVVEEIG